MIAGLVLAGGASRRMGGVDKLDLEVAGRTLLDRVLQAARPVCDRLIVVGPARPTIVPEVGFVVEPRPGGGPVPAVAAGLPAVSEARVVLVLAADLPLLTEASLRRLLDTLESEEVEAAAALDHGSRPNPLLAAYDRLALERRVAGRASGGPAAELLSDRTAVVDLGSDATLNVNRPEDLERARDRAQRIRSSPA